MDSDFCRARAGTNAQVADPRSPAANLTSIKTFSFKGTSSASTERSMLEDTTAGVQVPFLWMDVQWLARPSTAQTTPRYTDLVERQGRLADRSNLMFPIDCRPLC